MSYVARPYLMTERKRFVLMDAPLKREKTAFNWTGARGIHHNLVVQRLLDQRFLALDIEKDRFGRTAIITEAGRQALLGA